MFIASFSTLAAICTDLIHLNDKCKKNKKNKKKTKHNYKLQIKPRLHIQLNIGTL